MTQEEAITQFNGLSNDLTADAMENPVYLMTYAFGFAILGIVDCIAIVISILLWKFGKSPCPLVLHAFVTLFFVFLSLGTYIIISMPVPTGGYLQEMASILNGCTDEASAVPDNLI